MPLLLLVLSLPLLSQQQIAYTTGPNGPLVLDFYNGPGPTPAPAVILLHGGGLTEGTSRSPDTVRLALLLQSTGFAVFSVNYRLAQDAEFPAAVQDVASAAHWVRTHTRDYGVDARRVALVGVGEGGYLAALSAVEGAPAAAVVSLAGWSDLRNQRLPEGLRTFLGGAAIESASPAMHISGKEPPFLLVHGDADEVTPLEQSVHFQAALQAAGVPCRLLIVEGGGHDTATWTARPWEREMVGWLKRALPRK